VTLITINAADVAEYHGTKTPGELRLFANRSFIASDGTFIERGSPYQRQTFYQSFPASLVGTKIRIGSGDAYATTDALEDDGLSAYTGIVYDTDGAEIARVFAGLRIPHNFTPIDWSQLVLLSQAKQMRRPSTYLDSNSILGLLANYLAAAPRALASRLGIVKLDVDPDDLNNPTAVGINSPLLDFEADNDTIGHVFLDTPPANPAAPTAVGSNSAILGYATTAFAGRTRLNFEPTNPAIPIAVSTTDPVHTAQRQTKHLGEPGYENIGNAIASAATEYAATGRYTNFRIDSPMTTAGNVDTGEHLIIDFKGYGRWTSTNAGDIISIRHMKDPGPVTVFYGPGRFQLMKGAMPGPWNMGMWVPYPTAATPYPVITAKM